MYSSNTFRKSHSHCIPESMGDFIKPTDISYKSVCNSVNRVRQSCRTNKPQTRRRNVGLKKSSVKVIERTSSYQNLSGIINRDYRICRNSKSCEDISTIEKELYVGSRKVQVNKMENTEKVSANLTSVENEPEGIMEHSTSNSSLPTVRCNSRMADINTNEVSANATLVEKNSEDASRNLTFAEKTAMRKAFTTLVLNTWRRQRLSLAQIKEENESRRKQEGEILALKHLLEGLRNEANEWQSKAKKTMHRNALLKNANSLQKQQICDLNSRFDEKNTDYNNAKNALIIAKQEVDSLHQQMDKEREKLGKLRNDKEILIEKVHSMESESKEKDLILAKSEDDKKLIKKEQQHLKTTIEALERMNASLSEENEKSKKELKGKKQEVERLKLVINDTEAYIRAKDETIAALRKVCEGYMSVQQPHGGGSSQDNTES